MARYELELGDVVRRFQEPYEERFGDLMLPSHRRALNDIAECMTAARGGGRYRCNDCDHVFGSSSGSGSRSRLSCGGAGVSAPASAGITSAFSRKPHYRL